jgi:hypothetical protein
MIRGEACLAPTEDVYHIADPRQSSHRRAFVFGDLGLRLDVLSSPTQSAD